MEKKLIAAIAVVILIAAALMGSLVMLNQGDDNEPEQNYAEKSESMEMPTTTKQSTNRMLTPLKN